MKNLDALNLQMLSCLITLVAERSVTQAAKTMGMSQGGMSKMLAKLREYLEDPLLVRTNYGMVPTDRAIEISEAGRGYLAGLESVLDPAKFNPAEAVGRVAIFTAEVRLMLLLPR